MHQLPFGRRVDRVRGRVDDDARAFPEAPRAMNGVPLVPPDEGNVLRLNIMRPTGMPMMAPTIRENQDLWVVTVKRSGIGLPAQAGAFSRAGRL